MSNNIIGSQLFGLTLSITPPKHHPCSGAWHWWQHAVGVFSRYMEAGQDEEKLTGANNKPDPEVLECLTR